MMIDWGLGLRRLEDALEISGDYKVIEVSDDLRPFSSNERRHLIQLGIDHGLTVFGEVGAKWEANNAATLIGQTEECFDAGCELVLVEGAELVDANGEPMRELLNALRQALDLDRVLFELPGPWISGCTMCVIHVGNGADAAHAA